MQLLEKLKSSSFRTYGMVFGCCRLEFEMVGSSVYDWSRLGVFATDDPAEADLLIVGGWVNYPLRAEIEKAYRQMKNPKYVIAVGACAVNGTPFEGAGHKAVKASDIFNVDVFVPGCPPRPEMILEAILCLKKKIHPDPDQRAVLQAAMKTSPPR